MTSRTYRLDSSQRTRVFLLRHGVVAPADRNRFNGRAEAALDPEGLLQLGRAAEYLADAALAAVYASPRQRAQDSAAALARPFGLAVRVEEDLREMDFGLLDGLSFGEAGERFAVELRAWYADPARVRLPGAEVMAEVQARTWAALTRLAGAHPGADVAVVAHGAVNRVLLAQALGLDLKRVMSLAQDYGCLNILEFWPDRVIIKGVNLLPGPRLPAEPVDKT